MWIPFPAIKGRKSQVWKRSGYFGNVAAVVVAAAAAVRRRAVEM